MMEKSSISIMTYELTYQHHFTMLLTKLSGVSIKAFSLPYSTLKDNIAKLMEWMIDYDKSSTFSRSEQQLLKMIENSPMKLVIDPDIKPVACHKAITVPIH